MGAKIAYLGVDKRVSTETILRAAAAARDALGEESPYEFYVWLQRPESAARVRWFGLHAKMESELYPPSSNVAQAVEDVLDHLVFIRHYSTVCSQQFELFVRRPGEARLTRRLAVVGDGPRVGVAAGELARAPREEDEGEAVRLGLEQSFPGEGDAYWRAFDGCEVFLLARGGEPCAPVRVDAKALSGTRNFLPCFTDEDDLATALPDPDDAPPPESGRATRGQPAGIPVEWPDLLARMAALVPRSDARFEELGGEDEAPVGDGLELSELSNAIAARALAEEPVAVRGWLAKAWPHFAAAVDASKEGLAPAGVIGVAHFAIVASACGAGIGSVDELAKHLLELTAERAASLSDRGRRAVSLAALGLGAFEAVARCYGATLPARVEAGKKHSFGIENAVLYLAAGLRAKQPAGDLEPTWREIVAGFPYMLHLKKLEEAELFALARAHHVHGRGESPARVAAILHAEVRGRSPEPRAEPPRRAEPRVEWKDLAPRLRAGGGHETIEELRALTARAKALPPDALVGEVLFDAAERIAKLAVLDPGGALVRSMDLAGAMGRSLREAPDEPSKERARALLGSLQFAVMQVVCGKDMPPFDGIERVWLATLGKTHVESKLPDAELRTLLYAALGAGTAGLVPLLLGDPSIDARRGTTPRADPIATALHLSKAMTDGWPLADVLPAFTAYYERFPDAQARGEARFFELSCVNRAHRVHFGKEPKVGVAKHLRALVDELAPPPPPPVVVVGPARPVPTTPRPRRPPAAPGPMGFSLVELFDVHGLWGGVAIYVFADGDFWFDDVDRTKWSKLHRATMPRQAYDTLCTLLARHDIRTIRIPARPGVGGEASATLTVVGPGFSHRVMKWGNDRHPDFDALAAWLRGEAERMAKAVPPVWEGPFDGHWRPAQPPAEAAVKTEDAVKAPSREHGHPPLAAALVARVAWEATANAFVPYVARVSGSEWALLVGDFPEEPMYTLFVDGRAVGPFDDWPPTWSRPKTPGGSALFPWAEAIARGAREA